MTEKEEMKKDLMNNHDCYIVKDLFSIESPVIENWFEHLENTVTSNNFSFKKATYYIRKDTEQHIILEEDRFEIPQDKLFHIITMAALNQRILNNEIVPDTHQHRAYLLTNFTKLFTKKGREITEIDKFKALMDRNYWKESGFVLKIWNSILSSAFDSFKQTYRTSQIKTTSTPINIDLVLELLKWTENVAPHLFVNKNCDEVEYHVFLEKTGFPINNFEEIISKTNNFGLILSMYLLLNTQYISYLCSSQGYNYGENPEEKQENLFNDYLTLIIHSLNILIYSLNQFYVLLKDGYISQEQFLKEYYWRVKILQSFIDKFFRERENEELNQLPLFIQIETPEQIENTFPFLGNSLPVILTILKILGRFAGIAYQLPLLRSQSNENIEEFGRTDYFLKTILGMIQKIENLTKPVSSITSEDIEILQQALLEAKKSILLLN